MKCADASPALRTHDTTAGDHRGGNRKKPLPALTRAPAREADSNDEEEQRLLEQGEEGR